MRTSTGIHLSSGDVDNAKLLAGSNSDCTAVRQQSLQAPSAKLLLIPPVHLDGQLGLDKLVHFRLDRIFPFPIDRALELTRRRVREMRRLELVEPFHLLFQEMPHRRAEDVASRVQPRVQQTLLGVYRLFDRVSLGEDDGGLIKPTEVEDLALADGVHAHGCDRERSTRGTGHGALVGRLSASLGMENGLLCDDRIVFIGALLEELAVGFFQGCERVDSPHDGLEIVELGIVLEGEKCAIARRHDLEDWQMDLSRWI